MKEHYFTFNIWLNINVCIQENIIRRFVLVGKMPEQSIVLSIPDRAALKRCTKFMDDTLLPKDCSVSAQEDGLYNQKEAAFILPFNPQKAKIYSCKTDLL